MKPLILLTFYALSLPALGAETAKPSKEAEPPKTPLYLELAAASYPSDPTASCLYNPWGERLTVLNEIHEDFGTRVVTAAQVYADQKIRFDGYLGSDDDGSYYWTAADGEDGAWYGDEPNKTYKMIKNKIVDDLTERVWVCMDYPVHVLSLAGFPLREAIADDYVANTSEYLNYGRFRQNRPVDHRFYRRLENLQRFLRNQQYYSEDRITREQYRDKDFVPVNAFQPGDIVLFGHYGDVDKRGIWSPKHSGIVATIDERGLPVKIFNMRVSQKMYDEYDGIINHTRTIAEKKVFFKRFSDRYTLSGHGRIVNAYVPPEIFVDSTEPDEEHAPSGPRAMFTPSPPVAVSDITEATQTAR